MWTGRITTAILIQVLKESLRLYPTAGIGFTKEAPKECTLSGYQIPQGTTLWVSGLETYHEHIYVPY